MSKYTTELRFICESLYPYNESKGYNSVNQILDEVWDKVFDFDFPIFNEEYREVLCKKILKHYYTREICEETFGLWKLRLDSRMNDIMPYFNKLYDSELIAISPLVNNRYTITDTKRKTGTDTINTSGSGTETNSLTGSTVRTGGYTDTDGYTDTKTKNGTVGEVTTKTGTETLGKSGYEDDSKTGQITRTKQGTVTDEKTGLGNKVESYEGKGGLITDTNLDLFTDTPQGNILNAGGTFAGIPNANDVPIVGQDSAYLTTAEKNIGTKEDLSKWEKKSGWDNNYKETTTRTYGEQGSPYTETESYGVFPLTNLNTRHGYTDRLDTTTYNTNNNKTTTYNTSEGDTKSGSEQRVYNNQTDSISNSGSKTNSESGLKTILYGMNNDDMHTFTGSKDISDSKLLKEFRETFLNIDEMIIGKLSDLFILLW